MAIVVPNVAETAFLTGILADDLDLRLYNSDVTAGLTPTEIQALTDADFTEPAFAGYAAIALSSASWTISSGNPTMAVAAQQSFVASSTGSPETVFGYYVTDNVSGDLRWFEPFPIGSVIVEFSGDEIQITPTLTMDDREGNAVPVGMIAAHASDDMPAGWLLCDGSTVSRSTFSLLFAVIGETYGAGDGSTTFVLPDLQQRFPLGKAVSGTGAALGDSGGSIDHVHDLNTATSHAKIILDPGGNEIGIARKTVPDWVDTHSGAFTNSTSSTNRIRGTELDGDTEVENPPYQVVNWMIYAGQT